MPLELDSLKQAVKALDKTITKVSDPEWMNSFDDDEKNIVKSGVIMHFEFTYELCWKFIRRWLSINIRSDITVGTTRRSMFRYAAEYGLIEDYEKWMDHNEKRNLTSHTYQSETADKVFSQSFNFLNDAKKLLEFLENHND